MNTSNVNVVLAHGAWADGSSWSKVIDGLRAQGIRAIAAPLPLTSLGDDVAVLEQTLERIEGPVVLAGHAYAGAVIAAARSDAIKALVFVAALTPDEGETVGDVFNRGEKHSQAPKVAPDQHGRIWLAESDFPAAFAQHATPQELAVLAAVQRPISVACIGEAVGRPAWRDTPSWYLIAEQDRMIDPNTQHFMADRMKAHVHAHQVDHTPLVTAPDLVTNLIVDAVRAISAS